MVWDILGISLVVLWCLVAILLTAIRLPGTWAIAACAVLYGWLTGWVEVTPKIICVLVALAAAGEIVETLSSAVTARRAGASRQAMIGAILGGFAGAIFLSFLVPIPILGTMVGALAGCFGGAMLGEMSARGQIAESAYVGVVATVGFMMGAVIKTGIAIAMSGVFLVAIIGSAPNTAPTSVLP